MTEIATPRLQLLQAWQNVSANGRNLFVGGDGIHEAKAQVRRASRRVAPNLLQARLSGSKDAVRLFLGLGAHLVGQLPPRLFTACSHLEQQKRLEAFRLKMDKLLKERAEARSEKNLQKLRATGRQIREDVREAGGWLFDLFRGFPDVSVKRWEDLLGTSMNLSLELKDETEDFPWELAFNGSQFLSTRYNVGRVVTSERAALLSGILPRNNDALVVGINYTWDQDLVLEFPEQEAKRVAYELLLRGYRTQLLCGQDATLEKVEETLAAPKGVAAFHFSGHGEEGALKLADDYLDTRKLSACFDQAGGAPYLSFLNACRSAAEAHYQQLVRTFVGYGGEHVVGTLWSVYDEPCVEIAGSFYRKLRKQVSVAAALRQTRKRFLVGGRSEESVTGAAYVLYGAPGHFLPSQPSKT